MSEVTALANVIAAAKLAVATYPFGNPNASDVDWYMNKLREALDALGEAA